MTRLNIRHAELTPDFDFEGADTGTNEVKLTLTDGTEIFLSVRSPLASPTLSISTGLGRTIADLSLATFQRETQ